MSWSTAKVAGPAFRSAPVVSTVTTCPELVLSSRILNYFKTNPWTPVAVALFSEANLKCLATQLCIEWSKCESTEMFLSLLDYYDQYAQIPGFVACADNIKCINAAFVAHEKALRLAADCQKSLYYKYFLYRTSDRFAPYGASESNNLKNNRGFTVEQLSERVNVPSLECLASRNRGLTDPANRFLEDYRRNVL